MLYMDKTVKCNFCGELVSGVPAAEYYSSSIRNTQKALNALGTAGSVMAGDPVSAYNKFATGKYQESISNAIGNIAGGTLYHFDCKNCNQSFDENVL